jgi:diguanylate cyclase (GGDEF)-like protein/PAS domain S-box-containing protein
MERNRSLGVHIIEACCPDKAICEIVQYASAWFDGTRPARCGLRGESIPFGARMLAIQDAFDAMTTDMVYRRALPRERAIAELYHGASSQFDPQLVAAFAEVNNGNHGRLSEEVTRRWVDLSSEDSDMLWSFGSPLNRFQGDGQSIFQQRLLETMHDGVIYVDVSGRILVWNRGAERLTGLSSESVQHKEWHPQLIGLRDLEGNAIKPHNCPLTQSLRSLAQNMRRMSIKNAGSQTQLAVNIHVIPVNDSLGTCHGVTMLLHDISPEQSLERRVENLHTKATTDPLTGVGNRAEFDRRHKELVKSHLTSNAPCGLIIADIDKFKNINDTYGHQAGDDALVEFANLITKHCRAEDLVARYGGEEFVVLCPDCGSQAAARKAEEIRRELASTPQLSLHGKCMTASFGVTELQDGDTPETMLKRADRGLYQAKENGRNRVVQLGTGMNEAKDKSEKRSSWFSWRRSKGDCLVQRMLHSSVPVDVVAEKVRGFIADNDAAVVEVRESFVSLRIDDHLLPFQRRQSDRPVGLSLEIALKNAALEKNPLQGTLIEVKIRATRARDRRLEDSTARADQLYKSLKSYLIAEDY